MFKTLSIALALSVAVITGASAQDKKVTMDDFVGTWNIEVMSHQVALVIEKQDASKATGTLMMMGRDTLLKGELADRTITFVGVKPEGGAAHARGARRHSRRAPRDPREAGRGDAGGHRARPRRA